MKTPLFFIAAIAAFFALPFDFTMMASALFGAGLAAILISDYRGTGRAFGTMVPATVGVPDKQRLQLAA